MKKFFLYILLFIYFPVILIIVLISPFLKIRFFPLITNRIGHLSEDINLILSKKKRETSSVIDVAFLKYNSICNKSFYEEFVKKNFSVLPKFIIEPLYKLFFKLSMKHIFFENFITHKRISKKSGWENFDESDNNFKLSDKIIKRGNKFLEEYKIDPEKIVCINIWNSEHLKNLDWSHHNHRNGKFSNFLLTINYLISKGYTVIKVGRSSNKISINNKNFIDYSYNLFEDSLDLFLIYKCVFYISNSTGLDHLAFSFNKPMLINTPTINDFFVERKNIIYLLRPYFSKKLNRDLNIDEIIEKKLSFKLKSYYFEEQEVKINDNDSEEILLACKDLLYLIDKEFTITSEKLEMSNKFWEKYLKAKSLHKVDYDYYKKNSIKSYYSWSNIALKKIL